MLSKGVSMPPIKVACVGDSITLGAGTSPDPAFTNSYPAQLARMLGPAWNVRSFGVGGTTLLSKGDFPYITTSAFTEAKAFAPDIVVIMLGTNDTKPWNWGHKAQFTADYCRLVETFLELPSAPRVLLCRPPFVPGDGNFGINQPAMEEVVAMVDAIARATARHARGGVELVDIQGATRGRADLFPDRVHPNNAGAAAIAAAVYTAITGRTWHGNSVEV
jgi:lysophospholipase L1-like esterase